MTESFQTLNYDVNGRLYSRYKIMIRMIESFKILNFNNTHILLVYNVTMTQNDVVNTFLWHIQHQSSEVVSGIRKYCERS